MLATRILPEAAPPSRATPAGTPATRMLECLRMQPDIQRLIELQSVDVRLTDLRARLAAFPQQIAESDKRVADARQQLAAAKEALTGSLKDRKKYELDVDSWKEKARKYRAQSFEVKTNEAYKALQHEIEHSETEAAGAEDRLLERMEAGEEFERQVKAAEREIVVIERAGEADRQRLQGEQSVVRQELEGKEAERREKAASVPEHLLETYERVARRRNNVGVAEVRDETCSLCGLRIRPHVFQELRRPDCTDVFQCETCTRILYYIEPPAAAAPAAAAPGDGEASGAGAAAREG